MLAFPRVPGRLHRPTQGSRSFNKRVNAGWYWGKWEEPGPRWFDQRLAACERKFALLWHDCVRCVFASSVAGDRNSR